MRDRILDTLANEGILLEPSAADMVLTRDDPLNFVRSALSRMQQQPLVVTVDDLRPFVAAPVVRTVAPAMEEVRSGPPAPPPRDDGDVKILRDITGNSTCEGNIIDFARYFNDRFRKIKKILAGRRELVGCLPVSKATKFDRDVRMVAMVNEVRTTKNGHKLMEVEDEEGRCPVLILKDSPLANESIVPDEVVGIVGKTSTKGDLVVLNELIRPDLPLRKGMQPTDSWASVAFMSDVHVGSNTFLHKPWERMIHWLRTEGKDEVQYLLVPGDVVDGIGIFPGQEEELEIDDIFAQYESLAEHLKEIPDDIRIIVQPGNHDAVRPAEPQPTFPKEIFKLFDSSMTLVGNPCTVEIEGRRILFYHGRSLDDWIGSVQGLSYNNPLEAMKEMLKRRHMAPIYGGRTPLAPEKEDFLVIDEVPDIFVTGHVHGAGIGEYRGVKMICASTWQAQTPFQRMHNFNPDPAKLPITHLGTGETRMMDFA
ncbi:MAG: DNA-directed DNA polymerase II small subunit [Methanomassiliicoccus sp.]|nr:DNA-directed DNA polymerase II small subunit [Methanomassiliicoccus sp.]